MNSHKTIGLVICVIFSLLAFTAGYADIETTLNFDYPQFRFEQIVEQDSNIYTLIEGIGNNAYDYPGNPGDPELPAVTLLFSLPPGTEIDSVILEVYRESKLTILECWPHPIQTPSYPDTSTPPAFDPPGQIYYGNAIYPDAQELGDCVNRVCFMRGAGIGAIQLKPVRYDPENNLLLLIDRMDIRIILRQTPRKPKVPKRESIFTHTEFVNSLRSVVQNASDVENNIPFIPIISNWSHRTTPVPLDCVVITGGILGYNWTAYRDWMSSHGQPTEIVNVNYIYANYQGYDNAEKIRNYILDRYLNDGLGYVLLGGNVGIVPGRICNPGLRPVLCDLYFAELDGNWDSNGDHIYGDLDHDDYNIGAEVMVARVPAEQLSHVANWWNKRLRYETNPGGGDPSYLSQSMVASADEMRSDLWYQYINDPLLRIFNVDFSTLREEPSGGDPNPWQPSGSDAVTALNNGVHLILFMNHGRTDFAILRSRHYGSSFEPEWTLNTQMLGNITPGKDHITFAISCQLGNIDFGVPDDPATSCFAQVDIVTPGGSVAARYNSRPVSLFIQNVEIEAATINILGGGQSKLSRSHYAAKLFFPQQTYLTRERILANNLFGCPIMNIWTAMPGELSVVYPERVGMPVGPIHIEVSDEEDDSPISGAFVTLKKYGEVYDRGITDANGEFTVYEYFNSAGTMTLSVTKPDYIPFQGRITVDSTLGLRLRGQGRPMTERPALIWNPNHLASGDSVYSSLMAAGYQGRSTDNLALYFDSLSNYHIFIMGGILENLDTLIDTPYYEEYRAEIDTFLEHGGCVFWEGAWSLIVNNDPYHSDSLAWSHFQAAPADYVTDNFSYLKGRPGTNFENIDSIGYSLQFPNPTLTVFSYWLDGINDPLLAPESGPDYLGAKAAICASGISRTITTNFSWAKLHDGYANTRVDLITDIMNWLSGTVNIDETIPQPTQFRLAPNYPNPFNPSTTISFDLPVTARVKVAIYDIMGRKVATLFDDILPAGQHQAVWNARQQPSGVYFYRIETAEYSQTRKMVLLK